MTRPITIALAGNPNAGKTSLFNHLTGARAHVGNYPGVTVETKQGTVHYHQHQIQVVDLPGTYSLTAYSMEELVARNYILNERPDLVVDVVDAANLERNLYLALQFMEIGVPVVIALNMMDVAEARGLKIDVERLSELLGVAVVPTVARDRRGLDQLLDTVVRQAKQCPAWTPKHIRYGPDLDIKINEISSLLAEGDFQRDQIPIRWLAVKILEGDQEIIKMLDREPTRAKKIKNLVVEVTRHLRATLDDEPEGVIADHRYGYITSLTKQTVAVDRNNRQSVSDKIDLLVLNRLIGPFLLLAVLYAVYQFTFLISEWPVAWFEFFFAWLGDLARMIIPDGPVQSLIASGIIDGVGGVLGFVPLIAVMFFAIAILEDSGYMARIAFMMDRIMRTFGLHGNSVLALMIGGGISGGCAVPGVMAARTLRDPKERLATILVTPFMNCGAKLPIFVVLIAAFFAGSRAGMMFLLTILAWGLAFISARILRWTILKGEHTPFVMELPPYRMPTFKGLLIHAWERIWQYIKKAGTVILAISIIIWAMMTYPGLPADLARVFDFQKNQIEKELFFSPAAAVLPDRSSLDAFNRYLADQDTAPTPPSHEPFHILARAIMNARDGQAATSDLTSPYQEAARAYLRYRSLQAELDAASRQAQLRHSFAGRIGLALEGLTRPLGFDWRTNIALVGGFAAKEVIIATLGTAYSLSDTDDQTTDDSLSKKLASEPGWNARVAFILMLFVIMYSPCFVTLVTIAREAGWKWALFSMTYTTSLAYVVCLIVSVASRSLGF